MHRFVPMKHLHDLVLLLTILSLYFIMKNYSESSYWSKLHDKFVESQKAIGQKRLLPESWLLVMLHKVTYKSVIADTARLEQHGVKCFTLEFVLPLSKIKL